MAEISSLTPVGLRSLVSHWPSARGCPHSLAGCWLKALLTFLPHESLQNGYVCHQSQPERECSSKIDIITICNIITEVKSNYLCIILLIVEQHFCPHSRLYKTIDFRNWGSWNLLRVLLPQGLCICHLYILWLNIFSSNINMVLSSLFAEICTQMLIYYKSLICI